MTMHQVKLEASLACANLRNLERELGRLETAGVDYLHIDIMDGQFVPNFALDFHLMHIARELSFIPQDCHLMVVEPERYIDKVIEAGARFVTIHAEATFHVQRVLQRIRDAGAKSGIALNPATPLAGLDYILDDVDIVTVMTVNPGFAGQKLIPAMIRKIGDVNKLLKTAGRDEIDIQVDGNVSFQNIPAMVTAGATMLVGGTSSLFHKDYSISEAAAIVRDSVKGTAIVQ
jgi:ribulose-phosphate 3-epimerase